MPDEILLNEAAYAVWQTVKEHGPIEQSDVAKKTDIDQAQVSAAVTEAARRGLFEIATCEREELIATEGWKEVDKNLPERIGAGILNLAGGRMPMAAFVNEAKAVKIAVNDVLKWGAARGWITREKTGKDVSVVLTEVGTAKFRDDDDDYLALHRLDFSERLFLDELPQFGLDVDRVRSLLSNRPELAKIKKRTQRTVSLTPAGRQAKIYAQQTSERNELTPEDIEAGKETRDWNEILSSLRKYDVTLPAASIYPAKIHPLRKIIEQTRRAFLEMGFAEVASPMVESAFWNFDALFQPQDHPARDMQDTFYMRDPAEAPLPDEKIVKPVRRTHEDGWETGSEGWGYTWSPERSKQVVLRTHTTAATIRALATNPEPPGKFFCVGWTYRNETISFKHLPVFHQVDGIVVDEEANLASLMGTLQEFYSKMGFGRVKFKPAFYPYTEPSVDVVVYMESRKKWLEMGGAGIFRPEVTLPLGCRWPVLAWGLGIERLAMLRFGLSDIRDLYGTNLDALQQVPLCR